MSRPAKLFAWFTLALLAIFMAIHIGEKPQLLVDEIVPVAAPRCAPPLGHFATKNQARRPMS